MEPTTAALFAYSVGAAVVVLPGSVVMRSAQRRRYDNFRRVYECRFPADFDNDNVVNFLRAVAGMPVPKPFFPAHSVVFDVYGDVTGIRFFLSIPGHVVADVESWFRSHIVGGSLTRLTPDPLMETVWDRAREVKTSSINHMLDMKSPAGSLVTLLSGFSSLGPDEAALMQIVVLRAHFRPTPEEPPEAKAKLDERNFLVVGRIAARGERAQVLINRLYSNLTHMDNLKMRVTYRSTRENKVKNRIRRRSGTLIYPSTLNVPELSVLIGFPFGGPNVPGLPRGRARHLPPDHMIPTDGVVVGSSSFPGLEERRLAIPIQSLMMHEWVMGGTGSGKSTLLLNQAIEVIRAGHGLVVIEPKGDLARDILQTVPMERASDVIWFDPTNIQHPIGLNVLAGPDPERTTAHLVGLFRHLYGDSWGPRLEQILRYSVLTAALNDLTLYDVKQLLVNRDYRVGITRTTKDNEVKQFWRRLEDISDVAVDSVVNKLDGFLGSRAIRNIVGQTHGLNMEQVVSEHKILLVPLPNSMLGEANAAMLGSLIFDQLWNQIRLRPQSERYPIIGMLDEWQNYANSSVAMEDMLAEARSYQFGLILANQHTGQLPGKTLEAVKANARSKIVFSLAHDDAERIHKEFTPLGSTDLQTLDQYEIAAQLMTETGTAPVATARTPGPPKPIRSGNAIREASASTYGRPVREVETELAGRHRASEDRKKPRIG